jgi:hypothetical protein
MLGLGLMSDHPHCASRQLIPSQLNSCASESCVPLLRGGAGGAEWRWVDVELGRSVRGGCTRAWARGVLSVMACSQQLSRSIVQAESVMAGPLQNGARKRAGHIIWLGWMILLIGAAWLLPPLDSRVKPHPAAIVLVVAGCAVFLILGCISLYRYFDDSWRKWRDVPNKPEYVVWLSLETLAAIGVVIAALWGYSRL